MNIRQAKDLFGIGLMSLFFGFSDQQRASMFWGQQESEAPTKTYLWGNGEYQARPDAILQFKNFQPKLINTFLNKNLNLVNVKFGQFLESGIDAKGGLYVWKSQKLPAHPIPQIDDNARQGLIQLQKSDVVQIGFTKGFLFALKQNGQVCQWPINQTFDQDQVPCDGNIVPESKRLIQALPNDVVQISTGDDHFAALTQKGQVFLMGDDTYGQCGVGAKQRSSAPPFYQRRIKAPRQVTELPAIAKLVSGSNHILAITQEGGFIYGWGSNSNLQLSNEEKFSSVQEPLIAVYKPTQITHQLLKDVEIVDAAAGEEFSILVGKNKLNGETQLYGCGLNLHGELAVGYLKHIQDVIQIQSLSNYQVKTGKEKEEKNVTIQQIECGQTHCMALISIGAIMVWGENQFGVLGNQKRSFSEHPLIVGQFQNDNVVDISAGGNMSGVIIENQDKKDNIQK